MGSSFTLLRVKGIPIGAHWSWLVVFAFVVLSLARTVLPLEYPGFADGTYLVMALAGALLFFASIVAHELGHALAAIREGMVIEGISLWVFGGVARLKGRFRSPGAEFRVAIAGPLVSAALVGVFTAAGAVAAGLGAAEPVVGTVSYLASINAILIGFNLVPALPLDGGRVLRAWLWRRCGSFAFATAWAARAGSAFGLVLSGIGVLGLLSGGPNGGVWLIFLGWFLTSAARAEAATARVTEALEGLAVEDAMTRHPEVVPAAMSVNAFLADVVGGRGHRSYPVVDGERLVGVASLRRAGSVPAGDRSTTPVERIMTPVSEAGVVDARAEMIDAAASLQEPSAHLTVVEDGRVVGVVTASDLRRLLATLQARRSLREAPARRPGIATLAVVVALMAVAAGALYYPPVVVVAPGEAIDVSRDITITGTPAERPTGHYLLTSVRLERRNALGILMAGLRSESDVVAARSVIPEGIDPRRFDATQRELFRQSRVLAAAAAARAAGMDVSVSARAEVRDVLSGSPAAEALEPGDVIVAIDGRKVATIEDVGAAIRSEPPGTRFALDIERAGERRRVEVSSARLPQSPGPAIGVVIANRDLDIDLPFEVAFAERRIGGPSAGLAFALAMADMLDARDYARGRTIAVTGTIDALGEVGGVSGVEAKTVAAEAAGATLLIVPDDQVESAAGADLEVRGVRTLEGALRVLQARHA
jgi:PDZ domain-containing secreted protein/Zn-dependent protease